MTIAPLVEPSRQEPEARAAFRALALLARDLAREPSMREAFRFGSVRTSMGMSGDFETAIEEGSDLVRIGTLLYEGLEPESRGGGGPG